MAWHLAFVLVLFGFVKFCEAVPAPAASYETLDSRCEPLAVSMCKKLPYNSTHFPNLLGHETQSEANREIATFGPLVRLNCAPDLLRFLCSLYAPVCMPMDGKLNLLPPCRHHCKKVRKGCIRVLKQYGFNWPKSFKCNKFPKKKSNALCVDWSIKKKGAKKNQKSKKNKGKKNLGKKNGKHNQNKKGHDVGKGKKNSKGKDRKNKNMKNKGRKGRKEKKRRKVKRGKKAKKAKRKDRKQWRFFNLKWRETRIVVCILKTAILYAFIL